MSVNVNFLYKIPKDASYVTLRNQNRMVYANYRIQQNNVEQGCQGVMRLENGGVADADIITKLLQGARETTAAEIQIDISSAACRVVAPAPAPVDPYLSDKIYLSLTTNAENYRNAAVGSWIPVTGTEYTTIQTNVANTLVAGLVSNLLTSIISFGFTFNDFAAATTSSTNTLKIAANNYIYAFAINIAKTVTTPLNAFTVYANTSTVSNSGFVQVGNSVLPSLSKGVNYFVLKAQSSTNGATDGLLGITAPGNADPNLSQSFHLSQTSGLTGTGFIYRDFATLPINASTTLSSSAGTGWTIGIQALTSSSIQWVIS